MSEFQKDLYLIWSYQHEAWWRPGSHGYTWDIVGAGLYGKGEAEAIVKNARGEEAMLPARPTLSAFKADQERRKDDALTRRNQIRHLIELPESAQEPDDDS
jgi:hypothetical protein